MQQESASKLLVRLKKLAGEAGNNYYQRVGIVDQLVQDREWIYQSFKGDDYKAAQYLEDEYLHDLSQAMTVWQLLTIYRKFPEEADWQKHNYNLRVLLSKCKSDSAPQSKRRVVKVAEFEAVVQKEKDTAFRLRQVTKAKDDAESELETLRKRVAKLEQENAKLRGQVEELERIVHGKLGVAS